MKWSLPSATGLSLRRDATNACESGENPHGGGPVGGVGFWEAKNLVLLRREAAIFDRRQGAVVLVLGSEPRSSQFSRSCSNSAEQAKGTLLGLTTVTVCLFRPEISC